MLQRVNLGPHEIDTWYFSPYPAVPGVPMTADLLYLCEFDLKYFTKEKTLRKHLAKGIPKHPPGTRAPPPSSLSHHTYPAIIQGTMNHISSIESPPPKQPWCLCPPCCARNGLR